MTEILESMVGTREQGDHQGNERSRGHGKWDPQVTGSDVIQHGERRSRGVGVGGNRGPVWKRDGGLRSDKRRHVEENDMVLFQTSFFYKWEGVRLDPNGHWRVPRVQSPNHEPRGA